MTFFIDMHSYKIFPIFVFLSLIIANTTPLQCYASDSTPITICPPAKAKEIGIKANQNLQKADVPSKPRFFRWSMGTSNKPQYDLEVRIGIAEGSTLDEAKATAHSFSKDGTAHLIDGQGGKEFSETTNLLVSEKTLPVGLEPASKRKTRSEKTHCIFNTIGKETSKTSCAKKILRNEYTLPSDKISPGQTVKNFIELPFEVKSLKGTLNIKEEIKLLDYIEVEGRTLARFLKSYRLLNTLISSEIKECPNIYFSGASTVYYDLEKHSPYMISQFTRFQVSMTNLVHRTDYSSKLSLSP